MYIEHLSVENFKGFEHAELEFCRADGRRAGWHVLAGRNGAGKSSVLEAIALALRAENYAYRLLPDFQGQLRAGAKRGSIVIALRRDPQLDQFNDGEFFYRSPADDHDPRHGYSAAEDLDNPIHDPEPEQLRLGMTISSRRGLVRAASYTPQNFVPSWAQRGPWPAEPGAGWMIAGYGPFRRIRGHSVGALELMKESSGVASLVTLFHKDATLAEAMSWLRELTLEGKRPSLSPTKLLGLLNDGLLPDGVIAKRVDEDGVLIVERAGVQLALEHLSDGYRSVAALVFDLVYRLSIAYGPKAVKIKKARASKRPGPRLTIDCPGVVLIDEAETHLHPSWQRRLGFWLVAHFPNIQFIVTTHSPFICQAAIHGSLIRLSPPGDPRESGPLDEENFWTVVNGSPDEAVMTDLFGLERLISDEAEALRETIAQLEVKELRKKLTPAEARRLDQARHELPSHPAAELDRFERLLEKID